MVLSVMLELKLKPPSAGGGPETPATPSVRSPIMCVRQNSYNIALSTSCNIYRRTAVERDGAHAASELLQIDDAAGRRVSRRHKQIDCLSPARAYGQVDNGIELLIVATPPIKGNSQRGRAPLAAHHYEPAKGALICLHTCKQRVSAYQWLLYASCLFLYLSTPVPVGWTRQAGCKQSQHDGAQDDRKLDTIHSRSHQPAWPAVQWSKKRMPWILQGCGGRTCRN
jgi:hypothetical protein